jgi:hypothetical protein
MGGPLQRPYLTTNNDLIGIGKFPRQPDHSVEYEDGYLCGIVRGDGNLGSYEYTRPNGAVARSHGFRLALTDHEALCRVTEYLTRSGIETRASVFSEATTAHRQVIAISTGARRNVERIRNLISRSPAPSEEWCKGFLAGIYDAEGSTNQDGVCRLSNTDYEIRLRGRR